MALVAEPLRQTYSFAPTGEYYEANSNDNFYIYDDVTNEFFAEIFGYAAEVGVREKAGKLSATGFGIFFEVRMLKEVDLRSGGDAFFDVTYNGITRRMPLDKKLYSLSPDRRTDIRYSTSNLSYDEYEEIGFIYIDKPNYKNIPVEFEISTNFFDRNQSAVSITFNSTVNERSSESFVPTFTGVINSTVNLSIKNQRGTMRLRYYWYGKYGLIGDASTSSAISWTIPSHFWDDIPNSYDGLGWIIVERFYDYKSMGTRWVAEKYVQFTAEVPAIVKPTISSVTLTDDNATVRAVLANQAFAQIISDIAVTVSASGMYGSTIESIRSEIVGKNQVVTVPGGKFGPMKYSGQITIRTTVTDSRGRTSDPLDRVVTVLPYHPPILSFTASRGGTLRDQLIVTRSVKIAPLTWNGRQNNRLKLDFSTAPKGGSFTANSSSANMDVTTIAELVNSQATLAGTFSSLSSFEVLGTLTDSFVSPVSFKTAVGTDSVVVSYDKSGVGINKTRERGAVDVKGDIYANDKPIQQHQMTLNDGRATVVSGDWNNVLDTGFYMGDNLANQPSTSGADTWKYVRVIKHNDLYVLQEAIDFKGIASWYRVKVNGVWSSWKEHATASSRIDWTSTGVSGVHYKRDGDVVAVRINIAPKTYVSRYNLGKIPTALLPTTGDVNYYPVKAVRSTVMMPNAVKITSDGAMVLTEYIPTGDKLQTVITWMI